MVIFQTVRIILLTTIAFLVALAVTPFWYKFLKKRGFSKQIRAREGAPIYYELHEKKAGTPTGGGIIIWSTILTIAAVFWFFGKLFDGGWLYLSFINRAETYLPLVFLLIAALIGFLDDWFGVIKIGGAPGGGLKIRYKLVAYTFIAAIGAWWFYFKLGWNAIFVPFLGNFVIGPWYIPIFMFVIIASAFSANETDGLDGLLGGASLFAFVALTTVSFVLHRFDLAAFGGVTIGALLAFLWFNIYPAKFFMGDTGSMSLGIVIGVIAMLTNTTLVLPFFTIILVVEAISVIIQISSKRFLKRKIFLSTPIHHHFEALGWPESQVTMRFWIVSAVFSSFGLVIFFLSRFL